MTIKSKLNKINTNNLNDDTDSKNDNVANKMVTQNLSKEIVLGVDKPLLLDCGVQLSNFKQAYQTYGKLNVEKTNAILVCHALSGDQFASDINPVSGKPGWWNLVIGSGKILDTDRYFIICPNISAAVWDQLDQKRLILKRENSGVLNSQVLP